MLGVYAEVAEDVMAMPVIQGVKSRAEKFAGAARSYSIEGMMQNGLALQAGTSHDLGQNFGKAFDVKFQNKAGELEFVWQTSWGVSTRLIGGLVMTHSDDAGLIIPPKLAPLQAVIIPYFRKDEAENQRVIEGGRARGIVGVTAEGNRLEVRSRAVVAACGAIEILGHLQHGRPVHHDEHRLHLLVADQAHLRPDLAVHRDPVVPVAHRLGRHPEA